MITFINILYLFAYFYMYKTDKRMTVRRRYFPAFLRAGVSAHASVARTPVMATVRSCP